MYNHILSIILFTPVVGAFVLLFVPKENKDAVRWIANIFALAGFLVSLPLVPWFWDKRFEAGFKFIEGAPNSWIPSIGAGYLLGIDGISFLLIMLTTLLGWISILSSWTAIENRVKEYYIWFLILQTGMLGVFMALDFFLQFWRASCRIHSACSRTIAPVPTRTSGMDTTRRAPELQVRLRRCRR